MTKKVGVLMMVMLCSFASLGLAATSDSATWEGAYEANALPTDQGWLEGVSNANNDIVLADGVLTIDSMGTDRAPYWKRTDVALNFDTGASVEFRLKFDDREASMSNSACTFLFSNSNYMMFFEFGSDRVNLYYVNSSGAEVLYTSYAMNTTDGFHTYRLAAKAGIDNLRFYVDNMLVFTGTLQTTMNPTPLMYFGDVTGGADAKYELDYLRWTSQDSFSPPVTANSATWEGMYEANTLPTDNGWVEGVSNANSCAAVTDGVLTIDSMGTDRAPYWKRTDAVLNFDAGASIEFRLKFDDREVSTSNSACTFLFSNSSYMVFFEFGNDRVNLYYVNSSGAEVLYTSCILNTTDVFHTYRLAAKAGTNNLRFYVDNTLVFTGTLQTMTNPTPLMYFGDVTGGADAKYELDYLRWTTQGAFYLPAAVNSVTWEGMYEADVLPTDAGWGEGISNANSCAAVADGVLTIDSMGTDRAPYWKRTDVALDFETGISVEFRLKFDEREANVSNSACTFLISNSTYMMFFEFGSDRVNLYYVNSNGAEVLYNSYGMITTDGFHTYRLTAKAGIDNLRFYVDNTQVFTGTLQTMANPTPLLYFGDVTGGADAKYELDYLRWTSQGAFSLPASITPSPVFTPGGKYISGPTPITITCPMVGASIYYTIDGTLPTAASTPYTGAVTVSEGKTLKAIAVASDTSSVTSMTYIVPASYDRPETIPSGSVTVNGDLADWAGATWTPLDQPYHAVASDIPEAYYAAKWQMNKIYVAVKVRDTAHYFTDSYVDWNKRDAIEVYLHTDNNGLDGYPNCEVAQQYTIGFKASDPTKVWVALGNGSMAPNMFAVPEDGSCDNIGKALGSINGEWLYYEMEVTPLTWFNLLDSSKNVVSTLDPNDVIGLDVCVVGNNAGTYTGMKSENMMTGKSGRWSAFGLHKLVVAPALRPGDANGDGMVDVGDLGILAANYGGSGKTWAQGDFNGDGLVDVGDLGILAAHYGEGSTQPANFTADYTKAFGTTVADDETAQDDARSSLCSGLGLPLITGFAMLGLLLVKLEE
jgi:hypothetical protein